MGRILPLGAFNFNAGAFLMFCIYCASLGVIFFLAMMSEKYINNSS